MTIPKAVLKLMLKMSLGVLCVKNEESERKTIYKVNNLILPWNVVSCVLVINGENFGWHWYETKWRISIQSHYHFIELYSQKN